MKRMDDIWKREEIDSPCIKLCSIHPQERICIGCYRSIEEIGSWSQFSPTQRREIMADLPDRALRVPQFVIMPLIFVGKEEHYMGQIYLTILVLDK